MDKDIIDCILGDMLLSRVVDGDAGGYLGFGEPDSLPIAFSKDNFHSIPDDAGAGSRILFIDGGNAELVSSPGRCLHFVRVFYTIYSEGKRVVSSMDEFYVLVTAEDVDGKVFYRVKLFSSRARTLTKSFFSTQFTFDSLDCNIREGKTRFSISKVPGIIRRLAELSTALLLTTDAGAGDLIVLDGDLGAKISDESKLIEALRTMAAKKRALVCALSKTSSLLTSAGTSVSVFLNRNSPEGRWFYHPVVKISESQILRGVYFAKLHHDSDYVFKLETFDSLQESGKILSLLAGNSCDPVFLGYPYGLVEADRFARVSNRERDMLKTMFMAKAGKDWHIFDQAEKSIDAHSVLDNI